MMAVVAMTGAGLIAGCVRPAISLYEPAPGAARITTDELRQRANTVLSVRCPALLRGRDQASGTTDLTLFMDSTGNVQRSRIDRASGDSTLDQVIGALAAQLRLDSRRAASDPVPPAAPRTARMLVRYWCAASASAIRVRLTQARQ